MMTKEGIYTQGIFGFLNMKYVGNPVTARGFHSHPIHGSCMNAIVPNKTAENFTERPILTITALNNCILQEIARGFESFKATLAALVASGILAPRSFVVAEQRDGTPVPAAGGLGLILTRRYGRTALSLFRHDG